jgi:hypothetical protein
VEVTTATTRTPRHVTGLSMVRSPVRIPSNSWASHVDKVLYFRGHGGLLPGSAYLQLLVQMYAPTVLNLVTNNVLRAPSSTKRSCRALDWLIMQFTPDSCFNQLPCSPASPVHDPSCVCRDCHPLAVLLVQIGSHDRNGIHVVRLAAAMCWPAAFFFRLLQSASTAQPSAKRDMAAAS